MSAFIEPELDYGVASDVIDHSMIFPSPPASTRHMGWGGVVSGSPSRLRALETFAVNSDMESPKEHLDDQFFNHI
jgi:hypothetical protein